MIKIKFIGGAKKSFSTESMVIEKQESTIKEILNHLIECKPDGTLDFDIRNILIAVNGVDSSALNGGETIVKSGDEISIIPVIHGGSDTMQLKINSSLVELFPISGKKLDEHFIDELRKQFPKLKIQAVLSKFLLGKSHTKKIITISLMAQKHQVLLAKKLETDLLMRFAITNQISQAIKKAGINHKDDFVIIAFGTESNLKKLRSDLSPFITSKLFAKTNQTFLKKEFAITQKHLNSVNSETPLEDVLAEKAAILF